MSRRTERRIKDLRKALEPLREARAILGDVLMGADAAKLSAAFISIDTVIEHVELATDLSRRPRPQPFDPAVTEVKGPTTDQRTSCSRDALKLLREARVFILAAKEAAGGWLDDAYEAEIEVNTEAVLNTYEHAFSAEMRIADAIEGVRAMMGLPPDPLMVLAKKRGALWEAITEEADRADDECPEMQRLKEERDRPGVPFEEWLRLDEERERIMETNDRYAEVRRLEREVDLIAQEIVRIGEDDPAGLGTIDSVASQFDRDLAAKSRW